jgi:hypothetical protein
MFVRELAMLLGCRRVVLGLFVFAARVVMLGLMMVVRGCVVMTGGRMMMLARRMFRHLSAPLLRPGSDRRSIVRYFPADEEIACKDGAIPAFWQWFADCAAKTSVSSIGKQAAKSRRRRGDKIRLSVTGVDAAPALFYRLATNVTAPMAGRLL